MDEFDIAIVWEQIAQKKKIDKYNVEIETGIEGTDLTTITQKLKSYNLISIKKENSVVYFIFNDNLNTYEASRANNLGIDMDLLKQYCVIDLKDDYEILKRSSEFETIEEADRQKIIDECNNQRKIKKLEKIKKNEKDLVNLLNLTESMLEKKAKHDEKNSEALSLVNKKLKNILENMAD